MNTIDQNVLAVLKKIAKCEEDIARGGDDIEAAVDFMEKTGIEVSNFPIDAFPMMASLTLKQLGIQAW